MSHIASWKQMGVGTKVVASTLVVFAGLLVGGAYLMGQQLEGGLESSVVHASTKC